MKTIQSSIFWRTQIVSTLYNWTSPDAEWILKFVNNCLLTFFQVEIIQSCFFVRLEHAKGSDPGRDVQLGSSADSEDRGSESSSGANHQRASAAPATKFGAAIGIRWKETSGDDNKDYQIETYLLKKLWTVLFA